MTQNDDFIDKILQAVPEINPDYKKWKETYEKHDNSLETKLECLDAALTSFRKKEPNNKKVWEISLNLMEKHLETCREEEFKTFEIMFFEGILNTFSHIVDEEERKKAISLLQENLGPISKELCRKNNEFWFGMK